MIDKIETIDGKIKIVYIVGEGHSGSTLLSFILGTFGKAFNGGELKYFNKHHEENNPFLNYMGNYCSCGKEAKECPFWINIEKKYDIKESIYQFSIKNKLSIFLKIINPFSRVKKNQNKQSDYILYKLLRDYSQSETIIDASKSLDRLYQLVSNDNFEIKVIYLIRDGRATSNSFTKAYPNKKLFFIWPFQWIIHNLLIWIFLSKENISYIKLSYESLCKNEAQELQRISKFTGLEMPGNYIEKVKNTEFHVRAGNPMKNQIRKFDGLKYDEKWKIELSFLKRVYLNICICPFNLFFSKIN
jgi:hypothetical protein